MNTSSRLVCISTLLLLPSMATLSALGPGAEVSDASQLATPPDSAPQVIWVQPFATGGTNVQTDQGGPLKRRRDRMDQQNGGDSATLRGGVREITGGIVGTILGHQDSLVGDSAQTVEKKAASLLQTDLIKALTDRGLPARPWQPDATADGAAIVLSGQFVTIDEGSQLKRTVIGLGAGQSYLATQVQLYPAGSPVPQPFLAFHTEGDSGASPGALVGGAVGSAVTSAAVGASVSGARSSRKGTPSDLSTTAESIAKYLETYWKQQNW